MDTTYSTFSFSSQSIGCSNYGLPRPTILSLNKLVFVFIEWSSVTALVVPPCAPYLRSSLITCFVFELSDALFIRIHSQGNLHFLVSFGISCF